MTQKFKICVIGATAVGKTSLVERFVSSIFSERYATTIGVKIQSREVRRRDRVVNLVLWDLSGEDEFQSIQPAYLRGAAGYFVVIDGTRRETVETAVMLQERARATVGEVPFVVIVNKKDLVASWDLDPHASEALESRGWTVVSTSARTGEGVEDAFYRLVDAILDHPSSHPWT